MTTPDKYVALITSEHNQAPNYISTLTALVQTFVEDNNLIQGWPEEYDIDLAVGAQLDVIGQWVGLSRQLIGPIAAVFFSFDTEGQGFDQGVWFNADEPPEGIVSLDDATYRFMLYIKIAANHWNGSFEQAQQILSQIFATQPGTLFFLVDNFDMTMTQAVAGVLPSALLLALLNDGYISLRPAAVGVNTVIVTVDGAPLFGFDVENEYISGFDVGAWGAAP